MCENNYSTNVEKYDKFYNKKYVFLLQKECLSVKTFFKSLNNESI